MADDKNLDGKTSGMEARSFDGELQKDANDFHVKDSQWIHARNAINNSNIGDVGRMGNEPANKFCIRVEHVVGNNTFPLTIIGFIHLDHDKWAVFSTDNTYSEIGYFEESTCTYATIVNDVCLNFKKEKLIYGVSRRDFECNHVLYWADGLNVDRYLRIGDIRTAPYPQPWPGVPYGCEPYDPLNPPACTPCVFQLPLQLNCDLTRLETLMRPICMKVSKGALGGELLNGSYFVTGAYTVDGQKVTDYFTPSNVQPLFDHSGTGGSIEVTIEDIDNKNFDQFELVVVSVIAQQSVAKKFGFYSTNQKTVTIDIIDNQLPVVPVEELPVSNVIYEKSEALFNVTNYLLRVSPTSRFQFNYQPLANQIRVKWQSVEYPETYYKNGGSNTGYMRDEVYAFFIRWIYNTGERSASFHIPGRPAFSTGDTGPGWNPDDAIESQLGLVVNDIWEVENTAVQLSGFTPYQLCDGGVVIAEGYMGYWQSSEIYPDKKPQIWDSSAHPWSQITGALPYSSTNISDYDLCGVPIRHHKFPDNDLDPKVSHFRPDGLSPDPLSQEQDGNHIRILGVSFENIKPPRDNQGNLVPGVIGYEILRGSRKNSRSVIAKGIINNMVEYNLRITGGTQKGLFQNYPYNDLQGDKFLSKKKTRTNGVNVTDPRDLEPFVASDYKDFLFSFHSPETNFTNPYLSPIELKVYQDLSGTANMRYQYPAKHPKHVFPKDLALIFSLLGGIATALLSTKGAKKNKRKFGSTSTVDSSTLYAGLGNGLGPNPAVFIPAYVAGTVNNNLQTALKLAYDISPLSLLEALIGGNDQAASALMGLQYASQILSTSSALHGEANTQELESDYGKNDYMPPLLNVVSSFLPGNLPTFLYYLTEGADQIYRIIEQAARPQQHALQMISHCLYDDYTARPAGQRRRVIRTSGYVDNQIHDFSTKYKINNLYRGRFVALELTDQGSLAAPAVQDETRFDTRIIDLPGGSSKYKDPIISFTKESSTYYTALKQRLRNQYGQIDNIIQLPVSCMIRTCGQGGGLRQYSYPEGFNLAGIIPEGRGPLPTVLNAPLICDGNMILNPQFNSSPDPALLIPDFSNWTSNPVGSWTAGTFPAFPGFQCSGITLASNAPSTTAPPALLITPNVYPELIQNFATPLPNSRRILLSFNVCLLPAGYKIEVYLGNASLSPFVTVTTAGTYSIPAVPPTLTPLAPVVIDSIRFRSVGPVKPERITADVPSSSNNGNPWGCPSGAARLDWFVHKFSNITNNTNNQISAGQFIIIEPADSFTPSLYNDGQLQCITGLDCTSVLSYNLGLAVNKCNSFVSDAGFVLQVMKLTECNGQGREPSVTYPALLNVNSPTAPCPPVTGCPTGNNCYWADGELVHDISGGVVDVFLTSNAVTYSYSGSVIIQNPLPTDKYIILLKTFNVRHVWNGGDITVDTCVTQELVTVTDVCLQLPPSGAGFGCTDSTASNFDPTATNDDGSCIYYGCTDGNATNYCDYCIPCPAGVDLEDCECIYSNTDPGGPPALTGPCAYDCHPQNGGYVSPVMFGGDIYIGRYTEKNNFFYFFDWLYGQPDRYEWDYEKYKMFPYPSYWFNSSGMTVTESVESAWQFLTDPTSWNSAGIASIINPSDFHCFDRPSFQFGLVIKYGYMYLFNSGVRDFFVESEYNVDLRDFGDDVTQRHYNAIGRDSYTDTSAMFEANVIKAGNYYKYDNSLSIAKIFYSYIGWGSVYPTYYDPLVAETCYQYRPNKIIYSLPVDTETVRDNWRIFLTNNYKEFLSRIISVKQINKSGAVILFEFDSPVAFQGTDQLETGLGTKLTIGDGGLFTQPQQNLMNAERSFEYGSCQNRLSVVNTPVGTFWINQNQGKIFYLSDGLTEITMVNLKWWFAQFLPYQLTKYFPDYELSDNPVVGIGCQTVYDNTNNLVYFTKKDYKPVLDDSGNPLVSYGYLTPDSEYKSFYVLSAGIKVPKEFTDPGYFQPASWTVSYDVKAKSWVSFHDWHPDLVGSGKNTFMTTKENSIWIHNQRCDYYTQYYGVDYPFEIEYLVNTVQEVNTLRSIEYQLEVYKYNNDNCYDRFHVLDFNFDEAVIYNTEQCSGLLKLNITPKNKAPLINTYPQVNPTNIQILYSKEENKYRFNQFWDTTNDRGEFPLGSSYPPTGALNPGTTILAGSYPERTIWNTAPNGYVKTLNSVNLNYSKSQLERKRFRHYTTSVLLRRKVSGNRKMLISIANNKTLKSPR